MFNIDPKNKIQFLGFFECSNKDKEKKKKKVKPINSLIQKQHGDKDVLSFLRQIKISISSQCVMLDLIRICTVQ